MDARTQAAVPLHPTAMAPLEIDAEIIGHIRVIDLIEGNQEAAWPDFCEQQGRIARCHSLLAERRARIAIQQLLYA